LLALHLHDDYPLNEVGIKIAIIVIEARKGGALDQLDEIPTVTLEKTIH
jgi:hypothetical protein